MKKKRFLYWLLIFSPFLGVQIYGTSWALYELFINNNGWGMMGFFYPLLLVTDILPSWFEFEVPFLMQIVVSYGIWIGGSYIIGRILLMITRQNTKLNKKI